MGRLICRALLIALAIEIPLALCMTSGRQGIDTMSPLALVCGIVHAPSFLVIWLVMRLSSRNADDVYFGKTILIGTQVILLSGIALIGLLVRKRRSG